MSEKWRDGYDKVIGTLPLCLFCSGSNNSCVQVVDRWLDNAREQRALSLLSRTLCKLRGRMRNGDGRVERSIRKRGSIRAQSKDGDGDEE